MYIKFYKICVKVLNMSAKYIYIYISILIRKITIYITKLHNIIILYLKFLYLQNLHIYIDYVDKIILAFVRIVCDLLKLKHVYISPIAPILNVRP